jgi:hypothetical protein
MRAGERVPDWCLRVEILTQYLSTQAVFGSRRGEKVCGTWMSRGSLRSRPSSAPTGCLKRSNITSLRFSSWDGLVKPVLC